MKRLFTLLLWVSCATYGYSATYTAVQTGNWNDPLTWGVATVDDVPGTGVGGRTGDLVIIPNMITVTVPSTNSGEFPLNMVNGTWTIAGLTIQTGGTIQYNRTISFEAAANPFSMETGSTLNFNTAIGSQSTLLFKGTETFHVASNFVIQNWNSATVTIGSASGATAFGNLTIDHSTLSAEWKQSGSTAGTAGTIFNVAGTLTFNNLNGKVFSFCDMNSTAFTSGTIGNLVVQNGCDVRGRGTAGTAGSAATTLVVNGNVNIKTGSKLIFHANSASNSSGTLKIGGNLTIEGTGTLERGTGFAGSTTSASGGSYVEFNGTTNQTITIPALSNLVAAGTAPQYFHWRLNNTGMGTTVGGNLFLMSGSSGTNGGNIDVKSGAFKSDIAITYGVSNGLFYTGTVAQTAGVEMPASIARLAINNSTGLTVDKDITLVDPTNNLTLSSGVITMGTNRTMTLGVVGQSYSVPGGTAGSFVNLAAAGSGFAIITNSGSTTTRNFAIGVGTSTTNDFRKLTMGVNMTTSGALLVKADNSGVGSVGSGFNAFTSTRRYSVTETSGTLNYLSTITLNVAVSGQENLASYTATDLRGVYSTTSLSGTYNVLPGALWSSNGATAVAYSPASNFTRPSTTFYLAYGAVVPVTYTGAATGSWGDAANWSAGVLPTANDKVIIPTGKTVTLDGASPAPYTCADLSLTGTLTGVSGNALNITGNPTVNSGGILNVPTGSQINVGTSCGDNKSMTNAGTLNLTGGTLVMNGQLTSSATFNMSGGDLVIDPNSGVSGTSYNNSLGPLYISGGTAAVTGGTITFNDPVFTGSGTGALSNYVAATTWTNNTIRMGGIIGNSGGTCVNNTTTCTTGFGIYTSSALMIANLAINSTDPAAFTNVVSGSSTLYVSGDVTVPASNELRVTSSLGLGGNLVNNGTVTTIGTMKFETLNGSNVVTAVTVPQTVSGSGTFRDATSSPTSNFANLLFNNSNATGISFPGDVSTIYGVTHTAGIVTLGTGTNTLTIGTSAVNSGTYTHTAGRIVGRIKKWIPTGTSTNVMPISSGTTGRKATIQFTAGPSAGGTLTATFSSSSPGGRNLPATISGQMLDGVSPTGSWTIDAADGLTGGTYTATFDCTGFTNVNNVPISTLTSLRMLKAPSGGGSYTNAGTSAPSNLNAVSITGQTSFSEFALGGSQAVLAVDFTAISATNKGATNLVTFTTANEKDLTGFQIERSATGTEWSHIGEVKAKGASTYTFVDANPWAISYYRVRGVELSGKSIVSKIVSVNTGKAKLAVLNVYPSPTKNNLTIDFDAVTNSNVTILIKDITGRLVLSKNVKGTEGVNNLTLDVSNLSNGVYIMSINDNVSSIVKRIVKN